MEHYYHISSKRFRLKNGEIVLKPKKAGPNRAISEPKIARTCVGPSVPHCLIAVGDLAVSKTHKIYVYRTKNPIKGRNCIGVVDAHITQERWACRATKFVLVRTIKVDEELFGHLRQLYGLGAPHGFTCQKEILPLLKKYCKREINES